MPPYIRRKRASPTDLYRSCQAGGDCPPDVKNKIEGNTWADRLLKWFGNIIYLGGLGIGTGKGTGGTYGYRPLQPGAAGKVPSTVPLRPTVPVDTLPDIATGFISPDAPSVVPMVELPVDTSVVVDSVANLGPSDPVLDVSVIYEASNPTFDPTLSQVHHTNIGSETTPTDVVIASGRPTATRIVLDSVSGVSGHIDAPILSEVYNVFVDPQGSGVGVGALEEIELEPLQHTFEIEQPRTSTPSSLGSRALDATRRLYNRYVRQQSTRNPDFLNRPSRLVTFGFENPAYSNEELTLRFMDDVNEIAAAPDEDFADVRVLYRQVLSETPHGTVRASRFGTRGTMTTRSGVLVGQNVHFYYDLSAIENADALELMPVGDSGNTAHTVDGLAESSLIDGANLDFIYPDDELLDEQVEQFTNSHLIMSSTEESGKTVFVSLSAPWAPKVFIADVGNGLFVQAPVLAEPRDNLHPHSLPAFNFFSDDYYLHPSLRRRRKRKRPFYF